MTNKSNLWFKLDQRYLQLGISNNAAILLSIMVTFFRMNDNRAIYAFMESCDHMLYRHGESLTERMGKGRRTVTSARAQIATRVMRKMKKKELKRVYLDDGSLAPIERIVLYWVDSNQVTHYWVNMELLHAHLEGAHHLDDGTKCTLPSNEQSARYLYSQSTQRIEKKNDDDAYTETTPLERSVESTSIETTETEQHLLERGFSPSQARELRDLDIYYVIGWGIWIDQYSKKRNPVAYLYSMLKQKLPIPVNKEPKFDTQNKYSANGIRTYAEAQASQDDYTSGKYAWAIDS